MIDVSISSLICTLINILVLCLIVKFFLLKPVHKIIDERQAQIDKELEDAKASHAEADALAEQQRAALADIDTQRAAAVEESTRKATEVYTGIVEDANRKASVILKNAEAEGEHTKAKMIKEAQSEIRDLVIDATAKVIGIRTSSDNRDSALYDQFLKQAGGSDDAANS